MIENLDLSKWKQFSVKPNSENYVNEDGTEHLKLLDNDLTITLNDLKKEMEDVQRIVDLGIPTPKIIDLVRTTDNRIGYISEYISLKVSVSRAISKNPEKIEEYAKRFGVMGRLLHNTKCDKSYFPDITELMRNSIGSSDIINETQRNFLNTALNSVPCQDTCLHGDFQLSNVILSDHGDFFIDLGYFGYGNAIFDLGLCSYFHESLTDDVMNQLFHIDKVTFEKAMRIAIKEETNLDGFALEKYIHNLLPYGLCLFMYHISNRPDDVYMRQSFLKTLDKAMLECSLN